MSRQSLDRDVGHVVFVLAIDQAAAISVGSAVGLVAVLAEHVPVALVVALLVGLVLRHTVARLVEVHVDLSNRLAARHGR